jgi:transcriptional regulator with XRE-family HTH domain
MTAYQIRENIRRMREFRNLNQEDVAEQLRLSTRAYANIENGRAGLDIERLLQIADVLKISLIRLLTLHLNAGEDIADSLRADTKQQIFSPEQQTDFKMFKGAFSEDTPILPELVKQIEFLRQAYAELQQDKSLLRSEISELKSGRVSHTGR